MNHSWLQKMQRCVTFIYDSSDSTRTLFRNRRHSEEHSSKLNTESPSASLNPSNEHMFSFQTSCYDDILSKIAEFQGFEPDHQTLILGKILNPSTQNLHHALSLMQNTNPSSSISFTETLISYFEHSERTSLFCLLLHHRVTLTRSTYSHLHHLLDELPPDCSSLTQSDCDSAYDLFRRFDEVENPFASLQNFDEIRQCFTEIEGELHLLQRSGSSHPSIYRSIHRVVDNGVYSILGCGGSSLPDVSRKVVSEFAVVVDAVARGSYVMQKDIDTIDSLVCRLHTAVESDKFTVNLGLERRSSSGSGTYPIQQVAAQLRRKQSMFIRQLRELEVHICLFFITVNIARSHILHQLNQSNLGESGGSSGSCFM